MGTVYQGGRSPAGLRFAIAAGRFNEFIVKSLVDGALATLEGAEVVDVAWVPGAVEIPLVAQKLAETGRYDAIVAIGCIIRGGTPHFDMVANASNSGCAKVMLGTGVPVTFGILTVESIEQAIERAGTKMGNKGAEAASAAIEMATLLPKLSK